MANSGRMTIRNSAILTVESLQDTTIALSNGTIDDPYDLLFPKIGVPYAPQDQLCDACCHLANMIEDIDKAAECCADVIISRAMSRLLPNYFGP